jgi:L-alanine-DL-glutamate epimerase-like enolase superfamily enzyme
MTSRESLAVLCKSDGMAGEKPGGHDERAVAVGTLDMALWDLVGKRAGPPLYRVLADRYNGGVADARVAVYAAGGYYQPGKDARALQDELRGDRDLGYTAVKLKIGGAPLADDLRRIAAALAVDGGDGGRLAVDANGRFDAATALADAVPVVDGDVGLTETPGIGFKAKAALDEVFRALAA